MKVYISGPINGIENNNAEAFKNAENLLRFNGYEAISPLKAASVLSSNSTWKDYMIFDIKLLMECDYIYMLPNWTKSKGALLEKMIADGLQIKELILEDKHA